MENLHLDTNPHSKFIKKEDVKIISLNEVFIKEKKSFKNNFLKIDAQGYEKEILESGENILDNFTGISCEISVQPLYKGEAKFLDIINYLIARGFEIYSIHNSYYEINYGQTFSVDIVFIKKELFIN